MWLIFHCSSFLHNYPDAYIQFCDVPKRQRIDPGYFVFIVLYQVRTNSSEDLTVYKISGGAAYIEINPDSKFCGANMGPTWVLSAPDGPQVTTG